MSTRMDYAQIAAKLDYAVLEKKLEQLTQRAPPRKRKTAADVLEPLRDRLLILHRNGWSSRQLADELRTAGMPVSPTRLRECLSRWTSGGNSTAKSRTRRRPKRAATNSQPMIPAGDAERSRDGQTGLKLPVR